MPPLKGHRIEVEKTKKDRKQIENHPVYLAKGL